MLTLLLMWCAAGAACSNGDGGSDGFSGFVLTLIGNDTRYAPGYSEEAFSRIRVGVTESEVRSLLGEPLKESVVFYEADPEACRVVILTGGYVRTPPTSKGLSGNNYVK